MSTIREIARAAGVSPATVSRALTGKAKVSPKTMERIRQAMGDLGRREGRQNAIKGKKVGIVIPAVAVVEPHLHPALLSVINAFVMYLADWGVDNTTVIYDSTKTPEETFSPLLDGYLVLGTGIEQEKQLSSFFGRNGRPYILVNRQTPGHRAGRICFDDEDATERATDLLISLGHRKIAFVGGEKNYENTQRRFVGYARSLKKAGIAIDESLIFYGEYSEENGKACAEKILALRDRPTAVCCCSDPLAAGCMKAFQARGLSVPDDIAITGFGDEDIYRYITPALTTVQQPSLEVGSVAGAMIIQMIEHPDIDGDVVLFHTKLVVRESSGKKRA